MCSSQLAYNDRLKEQHNGCRCDNDGNPRPVLPALHAGRGDRRGAEQHQYVQNAGEIRQNAFAFYLGGLIAFAIGAVIVSLHNDFSGPLAIFISLIGWVALAEGVIMLAFPKVMQAFADKMLGLIGSGKIWGVAVAALGVILLAFGFA